MGSVDMEDKEVVSMNSDGYGGHEGWKGGEMKVAMQNNISRMRGNGDL